MGPMGNSPINPVLSVTLEELSQLFEDHFRGRSYFAFVYGSYAYGTQRPDSDMDILVAVEQKSQEDVDFVVSSVLDVHNRFNMGIDNEIPHSKKLLIDYSFLEAAVQGAGFRRFDNSIWIPPIVKTPEYLQSDELLLRFFLDSMVHKHVLIGGDVSKYEMFRANGVGTLTAIVAYMNQLEETDLSKLTEGFLKYDNRTGDFLFGFEDFPYYRKYLEEVLKEAIGSLEPYVMESVDWPHLTFDRLGLERYLAGALYRELEDRTRELDFAVNTNAFGSPQGVLANLDMSLGVLETYPDPTYEKTRNAIAKMCNVPSATVGLGVGATELLFAVPRVFPVNSYVAMRPSFWEYEEAFRGSGSVKLVPIQLDEQHGF